MSDLIFGLALSIGALALIAQPVLTAGDLLRDLVYFAFGFIVLIVVWVRYTGCMTYLTIETHGVFLVAGVFLISLLPYLESVRTLVWYVPLANLRRVAVARGGAGETARGHAGSRPGRGAKGSMNRRATHAAGTSSRMKMRSPGGPAVYTIRFAVRKFDRITDEITRFGAGCSCAPTVVHRSRTRAY